jgi:protein TonB
MKSFKTIRNIFSVAIILAGVPGTNNLMAESKDGSLSVDICAPEPEDDSSGDDLYINVDKRATFPGGNNKAVVFIKENLKYPEDAANYGIQGRVIVKFVVEEDGSISDIKVVRGVHPSLDAEAVRVVKLMPKWQPAERGGKPVRSRFNFPVYFKLELKK